MSNINIESLIAKMAEKTQEIVDAETVLAAAGVVKDEDEDLASQVDKLVKKAEKDLADAKKDV